MLRLRDVERMFLIAAVCFWVKAVSRVVPLLRDKPLTQRVRRALPDLRVERKTLDQICIDLRMMRFVVDVSAMQQFRTQITGHVVDTFCHSLGPHRPDKG